MEGHYQGYFLKIFSIKRKCFLSMTRPDFYHSRYHLPYNFRIVLDGGNNGTRWFPGVCAQWRSCFACRKPSRSGKKKCVIQTVICPRSSTKKKPGIGEQLPFGVRRIGALDITTKDRWKKVVKEGESITMSFVMELRAGTKPDSVTAMDLAEQHREHINRWFYECSHTLYADLGLLYVSDSRFRYYYDKYESELADYVKTAIHSNRVRSET